MNLFALMRDGAHPIVRIPLSGTAQSDIIKIFKAQELKFRTKAVNKIPFDGKYKPDDDECLTINNFDDIDNIHYAVYNAMGMPEIKAISSDLDNIKALFVGYADGSKKVVLIQSFDRRRVLSTKGYTIVENLINPSGTFKRMEDVGLTLDNKLSAILTDSELDFFSFFAVRHIFDMNEYYQEATDDDLRVFQSNEKIAIEDLGNFIGVSDQWIRRKVVLITQSGVLDRLDVDVAKGLALSFGITIQVKIDGTKKMIDLPTDKRELKQVLNFLAENYFISLLTNTPSLSNSSRAI